MLQMILSFIIVLLVLGIVVLAIFHDRVTKINFTKQGIHIEKSNPPPYVAVHKEEEKENKTT